MALPQYRDSQQPLETRIEDLIGRMSVDEKLAQLGCLWSTDLVRDGTLDVEVVAAKMPHGIGQITRIGASTGLRPRESAQFMNAVQHVAVERTRLGIPVVVHEESAGGFCHRDATTFPQALGLAATWNADLLGRVAHAIGEEMRAVGARVALAPVLDVARDPRWGRVEETYGEDPVLAGVLGVAYVRGLQGDDLRHGVVATGKHFLGYAMSEGGRNWGPVHLGPREVRDVYAEPFAAAIRESGLAAVMNSYASLDGLPCAGSHEILTRLLRDELGFDGVVLADYFSVAQLFEHHHIAGSLGEAACLALQAGLDMELPALRCFGDPLKEELKAGRMSLDIVDTAVRRVLRMKFSLGLFEQPYVDVDLAPSCFDTPVHRQLARAAAAQSVVLLSNDGVLPIAGGVRRIAIIGPGAADQRLLQGDYHYPAHLEMIYAAPPPSAHTTGIDQLPRAGGAYAPGPYFTPHVTPLAGLKAALAGGIEVVYAQGFGVLGEDRSGFEEAVRAARDAQIAVVVVAGKSGLMRPVTVGEGNDATDLDLTGAQQELVDAVADTGTPLVLVVMSGRVHTLERVVNRANAAIWLAPAGEEGGTGLADILTGAVNPSGRLPVSLPHAVGQVPVHVGVRAGGTRAMFFGDYTDAPATPLFPFGHGLSYTRFSYSNMAVRGTDTVSAIQVGITVRNEGDRDGDEVVQVYCRDMVASVARPERMLVGFARLSLAAHQAQRCVFTVHPSRLAFFDRDMSLVTEPGEFVFSVGASSADIRAELAVTLSGEKITFRQPEIVATQVDVAGCGDRASDVN